MSDNIKLALVIAAFLVVGHVEYKSEVALEEAKMNQERLARLDRAVTMYLPPTDCSHCHNMRVGATKGGYK